jgi:hypothetical protein
MAGMLVTSISVELIGDMIGVEAKTKVRRRAVDLFSRQVMIIW